MNTVKYLGFDIDLEDKNIYNYICNCQYLKGVFQLETHSAANVIREIRPKNINDLSLVNSLNRPSSIKFAKEIALVRNGDKQPQYIHPSLEGFLKHTYGFLVYQESVLKIAQGLAGFTPQQSSVLLKAIGKKSDDKMASLKIAFTEGVIKNGFSCEQADKLFSYIKDFANYAFNFSHSISYSIMGYVSAWFKYYHPLEFFTSALNFCQYEQKPMQEIFEYTTELDFFNIKILHPSVQKMNNKFVIEGGAIRYPIGLIKGVGESIFEKLKTLSESQVRTLESCLESFMSIGLNSRSVEFIIISGALDCYGVDREYILFYYWFLSSLQKDVLDRFWVFKNGSKFSKRLIFKFLHYKEEVAAKTSRKQLEPFVEDKSLLGKKKYKSYFKTETTRLKTLEKTRENLRLIAHYRKNKTVSRFFWESHALGFSYNYEFNSSIRTFKSLDGLYKDAIVSTCGFIDELKFRTSAKGNPYGIISMRFDDKAEFMLFNDVAIGAKDTLKEGDFVLLKLQKMDEKLKVESVNVINKERKKYEFYIKS